MTKKQRKLLGRILTCAVLMLILHFIPAGGHLQFLLYLIPYWVIGHDILKKAWKGIKNKRIFDENFLMATATIGAMIIGLAKTGDYVEGIAVMLFYQIGELFQSYAVGKSRKSITALMDIRPDYANVMASGNLTQVDPTEVAVGTIIVVQPGEKIPIDGTVLDGTSSLNTSALTGESLPRDVRKGDAVISGCINMTGILKIRTTKGFGESTVSKVLDLVENASSLKSKSEAFISKFSRVYTPVVCFSALALAVIPPAVSSFLPGVDPNWSEWIYRALSFLVASCPCALVISIPLTFFASIGGASAQGILVKGSNYLEALAKTGYVVFDKTGTLTQGVFQVKAVCPVTSRYVQEQLLEYAAYAECASSHPISKSLLQAYGKAVDRSRIADIQEISGNGVVATVDGKSIAVGNNKLMQTLCIRYCETDLAGTVVHIAIGGEYAGYIVISDMLKPTAKAALSALKTAGIQKTVMLTGDSQKVAEPAAQELGVDAVFADLLPCDKVSKLEMLLAKKPKDKNLVFVGDGINDAPVLSRADVGIAMGGIGSDAAIEAADIVLMDDDPMKIVKAIKIARKCMGIVKQNTVFAIGIKLLVLILVALGFSNMWAAVFADVGVMVLAVLNAIRALFVKNL